MALRKHAKGRSLHMPTLDLPGSPKELWKVIATGEGMAAWLVRGELEERLGGAARFQLGPGKEGTATVSVWEPPLRFAYDEPGWSGDAPPLTTELTVAALDTDRCALEIVHTLHTAEDLWDAQLESLADIWPPFFGILRLYLTHHRNQPAATIRAAGFHPGPSQSAWESLLRELNLQDGYPGARRSTVARGAPALSGAIDNINTTRRMLTLHFDQPHTGVGLFGVTPAGDGVEIYTRLYYYGIDAAAIAQREEAHWSNWMTKHFPQT